MRGRFPKAVSVAALVLAVAPGARAQEGQPPAPPARPEEAPVVLPEVVVTATRSSEETGALPHVAHAIAGEEFRVRRGARTLPQAIAELPAVSVQQTAHGQESPFIRGFTGFRTLLLVDGIRINNATFREGPNQYWGLVDPLAVERIEVVKGPASVLYGSDAVGGTVNALTPEEFPEGAHPGGYWRFAGAERSHTVRADLRGTLRGTAGYAAGAVWRDFDDLSGGRRTGLQEETGYESLSGDAKLSARPAKGLELTAAFQSMSQYDAPRTHSTVHGLSFHGTRAGTDRRRDLDQDRRFAYLRGVWAPDAEWLESVSLTLSYQLQGEEEKRTRVSGVAQHQGFEDHTGGAMLTARSPSPVGDLAYGVEYYGDWVEDSFRKDFNADGSLRSVLPRGPVADHARYHQLGVFLQDECHPFRLERLTLIAGARYNFARAEADAGRIDPDPSDALTFGRLAESYHAAVGSGRLLYRLGERLSTFAGVSQGFRAPNLSDLTRFDIARSGEEERPATGLDPEYFTAYEGGLHARWGRLEATAAYFYTDIRDLIVRFPTGEVTAAGDLVVRKENVGDGHLHGVEASVEWRPGRGFTAIGSFSWMEGEVDTFVDPARKEREPLSRVPPPQWLLGLRYEPVDGRWWVESTLRVALRQERLSPEDRLDVERIPPDGTPGYHLLGLRGGVRVGDRLRLFAGVENLTDQDYRVHGSGVNGPGTSFVGGLEARL